MGPSSKDHRLSANEVRDKTHSYVAGPGAITPLGLDQKARVAFRLKRDQGAGGLARAGLAQTETSPAPLRTRYIHALVPGD
jgi:hypothetical protein